MGYDSLLSVLNIVLGDDGQQWTSATEGLGGKWEKSHWDDLPGPLQYDSDSGYQ